MLSLFHLALVKIMLENPHTISMWTGSENTFKDYPDIVSFDQMREMPHIGRNKAHSLIEQKKICSIRIGRRHKIPKISVIEFLNQDSYNN